MQLDRILVTGGSGLVGSALREMIPQAIFVNSKDADLMDICQVRGLFERTKPQYLFHLAARVGGVKTNLKKNADLFTTNVMINTNVLSVAREFNVRKLVTVLSSCIFHRKPENLPSEKEIHLGMPFAGHLGYGYAKRMMDLQIHLLHQQYGVHFTSIIPATIFGPHGNWTLEEGHVVEALIQKCYLAKKGLFPLKLWGTGESVRQFVYSRDIARILIEVLEKYDEPETIIVAPEKGISICNLAEIVSERMGFTGKIIFDPTEPEGEKVRVLNNSKFRALFPNFQFTPLETALDATIKWFMENVSFAAGKVK